MKPFSIEGVVGAVREVVGPADRVGLHEPEFRGNEVAYLTKCITTGWVSYLGEYVERFERELAALTGTQHAVVTVNGTVALHAALLVAGINPGDEVLVPALTFVATANAIAHAGAVPHFVDSERATLGLDPDKLERYLDETCALESGVCRNRQTGRAVRAVIPVHIFGHPVRMGDLIRVAGRFNLIVIEDAAEALGSTQDNRPVGGDGLMSVLSFNGNKVVTTGGGGAILTNDAGLAKRFKSLTTTAKKPHPYLFDHDEVAYNYRMPNINAAVGCAQLEQLPGFLVRKRRLAERYRDVLAHTPGVTFVAEPKGSSSNYWLNALLLDEGNDTARNPLLEALIGQGLQCRPMWTPMHHLPMYSHCPRMNLDRCEDISRRLINLPSSPALAVI